MGQESRQKKQRADRDSSIPVTVVLQVVLSAVASG